MPSHKLLEGAMPPLPKANPARRNKSTTRATLTLVHNVEAPELPDREQGWHRQTCEWWHDLWASPMAPEYDQSDRHGLFMLAVLVDEYWREPSTALASEIRLQRQCYGMTPIDRRRLQWEIERVDEAVDRGEKRRAARKPSAPAGDDLAALRAS